MTKAASYPAPVTSIDAKKLSDFERFCRARAGDTRGRRSDMWLKLRAAAQNALIEIDA